MSRDKRETIRIKVFRTSMTVKGFREEPRCGFVSRLETALTQGEWSIHVGWDPVNSKTVEHRSLTLYSTIVATRMDYY